MRHTQFCEVMIYLLVAVVANVVPARAADKTLIDYFQPMPIQSPLVSNVWGAA